ncbi:MbcA/ParS/Xre antitoxin family protein [Azospirillum largimobile]
MPARANRIAAPVTAGPSLLRPDRFAPSKRRHLSAPGLRTFLAIADRWGWTEAERLLVLGSPGRSTYFGWAAKARDGQELTLPVDVLLRISAVLGIHKALMILFGSGSAGLDWLTGPHDAPSFGGQPPMALVTNGTMDGPMLVRRYLDAARGGVFGPPGPLDEASTPYSDDDIVIV